MEVKQLKNQSIEPNCIYKEAFNNNHTSMMMVEAKTGDIKDVNLATCNYYLYSKEELLSMNISEINTLSNKEIKQEMNKAQSENRQFFRLKHTLSTGEIRDVEVYSGPVSARNTDLIFLVIHDIKEKSELEKGYIASKVYFDSFFNNSPEAIAIVDNDFRILNINNSFEGVFQYKLKEIENEDITKALCEKTVYDISYDFRESIAKGKFIKEEVRRKRKDGSILDALLLGFPLVIEKKVVGFYFIYSDITEIKEKDNKIKMLTYTDILTGLFNREFFLENLDYEIRNHNDNDNKSNKERFALIILKVNEFKEINDALGHLAGDQVLKEFSLRLRASVGVKDIIARFSEDEFAILLPRLDNSEEIKTLSNRIIKRLEELFSIGKNEFQITTSMGVAIYPDDGRKNTSLVRKSEIAMNKSKESSVNTPIRFENSLDNEIQEYFWMKKDLAKSIVDEELFLNYQPIYDITINKLVGVEALIRWNNRKNGMIPPTKFIPVAEKTGMIHPIGEWVLIEACKQNKKWQGLGYEPMYVSVNVSVLQLEKPDFSKIVKRILKESKLDPKYLQLEITETFFTQNYELIERTVKELSDLGVKLAIDDFGTGYSSLGQLCELNINTLKIDRMFIDGVDKNINKSKIVKAVISLAESLNISLTAEGVETQDELNFLKTNRCTMIQGYLLSKPVGIDEIEGLLETNEKIKDEVVE